MALKGKLYGTPVDELLPPPKPGRVRVAKCPYCNKTRRIGEVGKNRFFEGWLAAFECGHTALVESWWEVPERVVRI